MLPCMVCRETVIKERRTRVCLKEFKCMVGGVSKKGSVLVNVCLFLY